MARFIIFTDAMLVAKDGFRSLPSVSHRRFCWLYAALLQVRGIAGPRDHGRLPWVAGAKQARRSARHKSSQSGAPFSLWGARHGLHRYRFPQAANAYFGRMAPRGRGVLIFEGRFAFACRPSRPPPIRLYPRPLRPRLPSARPRALPMQMFQHFKTIIASAHSIGSQYQLSLSFRREK